MYVEVFWVRMLCLTFTCIIENYAVSVFRVFVNILKFIWHSSSRNDDDDDDDDKTGH
jgi:hypothetical protein